MSMTCAVLVILSWIWAFAILFAIRVADVRRDIDSLKGDVKHLIEKSIEPEEPK